MHHNATQSTKDTNWQRTDPLTQVAQYITSVEKASKVNAVIEALTFDHEVGVQCVYSVCTVGVQWVYSDH